MKAKKLCEVHNTALELTQVPVSYGLPRFDKPLVEARMTLFPNSRMSVNGGCTFDSDSSSTAEEYVCRECRQAESQWRKENNRELIKSGKTRI